MLRNGVPFRPWGQLSTILNDFNGQYWKFIGCVSSEDRCSTVLESFQPIGDTSRSLIFKLIDSGGRASYSEELQRKTLSNTEKFTQFGHSDTDMVDHQLDFPFEVYTNKINDFLDNGTEENIVLDITTMPKRIFFYIVKKLYSPQNQIKNIIVTYTEPDHYGESALAENPRRWAPLPGFNPPRKDPQSQKVIIGIGFEPLGLPELVISGEFENIRTALLFPFPSSPKRIAKNWKFVRDLFPNIDPSNVDIKRVDTINVPDIYDTICRIGDFGQTHLTLAPYGPKPVSLAMALYASRYSDDNCPTSVYYTQPTVYSPDYSTGVKFTNGAPVINTYCIRINGNNLY